MSIRIFSVFLCAATLVPIFAQEPMDHSGMDHGAMDHSNMNMTTMNPAGTYLMGLSSGTASNPRSWTMPMIMQSAGSWNFMLMGQAFIVDTQQGGPRGGDKLFSTNWFMSSAEHRVGQGAFMATVMLSLEPATITERRYPELFQTGETAFGNPIVDGQHPHNFVMGLGLHYAHPVGENGTWEIYYAPVGDPALGPVAYPHRASAMELPQATLGHHWEDATHISFNVVTGAVQYKAAKLEVSGFHGQEPGENRWTIGYGAIDSWSARASVFPAKNWMAQVSVGRIARPEPLEAGDVTRVTSSIHYTRPTHGGDWSTSLIYGRNHSTATQRNLSAYTLESVFPFSKKLLFTGRAELVDKDELLEDDHASGTPFRVGAYTAGLTHDFPSPLRVLQTGVGFNATAYSVPDGLKSHYGDHPWAVAAFFRVRLRPEMHR